MVKMFAGNRFSLVRLPLVEVKLFFVALMVYAVSHRERLLLGVEGFSHSG
jgi:hypothetical protein